MQEFTLFISSLLAGIVRRFAGVSLDTEKEVHKKLDPRGLVRNDLAFIRSKVPAPQWKPDTTIQQVAYAQGQQDLIVFIETRVVGRRVDG